MSAEAEIIPIKPPEIQGRIDAVSGGRIYGWAWDRRNRDARLEIEVRLGDRSLGTTVADRERPDLAPNGIGDGRHAFELDLGGLDPAQWDQVAAVVRPPAGGSPIALPRPSMAEKEAERVVAPALMRMAQVLEAVGSGQRKAAAAHAQALAGVRELVEQNRMAHDGRLAAVAQVLDRIAERQVALDERLASLEVFAVRFDEGLRALDEHIKAGGSGGDRGLQRWLAVLAAGTLAAAGLTVYAVVQVLG